MKHNVKRTISALAAVCVIAAANPAAFAAGFDGHWAQTQMESFADQGYLTASDAGQDTPDAKMTRAEFASVINRIKNYTEESPSITRYSDVSASDWFYQDLAKALAAGYMEGDEEGNLNPLSEITRQDAFVIIARVAGLDTTGADASVLNRFADAAQVSDYARDTMAMMVSAGYVEGSDGSLNPTAPLTWAEGVTLLNRMLDVLVEGNTLTLGTTTYAYSTEEKTIDGVPGTEIGSTGVYYAVISGTPVEGTIYGTATLSYKEFYAGDVSDASTFDAVTSATTSKGSTFPNSDASMPGEDGYQIYGAKNVSVAVDAQDYVTGAILARTGHLDAASAAQAEIANSKFTPNANPTAAVEQVKTLNADGTYSATKFHIADTLTTAAAELQTATTWGDYQINVYDPEGVTYLRNTRSDEGFVINSQVQGIILETASGLKVGMAHMENIWVQPYEIAFSLEGNANSVELNKLVGETVTKITFILPDSAYVYEFEGIYIKPQYTDTTITGSFSDNMAEITLNGLPEDVSVLENAVLSVGYKFGRNTTYLLENAPLVSGQSSYALDTSEMENFTEGGSYVVTITSDNFATLTIKTPMTEAQKATLESLVEQANAILASASNDTLASHRDEALELLADADAASGAASELISELTELIAAASK